MCMGNNGLPFLTESLLTSYGVCKFCQCDVCGLNSPSTLIIHYNFNLISKYQQREWMNNNEKLQSHC